MPSKANAGSNTNLIFPYSGTAWVPRNSSTHKQSINQSIRRPLAAGPLQLEEEEEQQEEHEEPPDPYHHGCKGFKMSGPSSNSSISSSERFLVSGTKKNTNTSDTTPTVK